MLLEAATNIVLPSNGNGWVKLRSDDFSDLDEHHVIRGQCGPNDVPIISATLWKTIKGMMRADPGKRTTLQDVRTLTPLNKLNARPALVEENDAFLSWLLM